MINLNNSSLPVIPRDEAQSLLNLLAVLADPELAKGYIAEIRAERIGLQQDAAACREARQHLEAERAAFAQASAAIDQKRADATAAIAGERRDWDAQCKKKLDEIQRLRDEATLVLKQAREHEAKAKQARENLEARLEKIKQAAA
jgi:hypothetical protein